MNYDATLLNYFMQASLVVKCVMLLLVGASIFSWSCIMQRFFYLRKTRSLSQVFENSFATSDDLNRLFTTIKAKTERNGVEGIFYAGYKEYLRMRGKVAPSLVIENVQRSMRVAQMHAQEKLEAGLPFLAIVGSTSPYVGLFGTVWGIMQAFRSLANVSQATIAMVAPGIAEALIATALGLFAAIPAVIAYNRFLTDSGKLMNRYDAFQEMLINFLTRKIQVDSHQAMQARAEKAVSSVAAAEASPQPAPYVAASVAPVAGVSMLDLIENTVE